MRLVLIGAPGSGKGTQSALLCRHFGIPHLSTGEILRKAKADNTALGRRVAPIMDAGGLVDDELMLAVVHERMSCDDCHNGFLLDGFPRSLPQAEGLDQLLADMGCALSAAVELRVSVQELERRLVNRYHEMTDPRPEDQPAAIAKRLALFESITSPLLDYYQTQGVLVSVNGMQSRDQVFQNICESLKGSAAN